MGCCGKPVQGSYRVFLRRGEQEIDLGIFSRPLGYSVAKLGAEYIRAQQFGFWEVWVKQGYSDPEFHGTLRLTKNAVDFDQKASPIKPLQVEGVPMLSRS